MPIKMLPALAAALLAAAAASAQTAPSAATSATPAVPATTGPRIDPQALHIALSSLLLAATKMAVEEVLRKTGHAPDSNAAAHVGAPDYLTSSEISSITVRQGGVLDVHFTSAVSHDLVRVRLRPVREGDAIQWSCTSPDIVQIQAVESYCSYRPDGH